MEELNVAAQIKIYLDDPKASDEVKSNVGKIAKVQKSWEEDIGFGIKVLKVNLLMSDSEGGMESVEKKIREVAHVSEVEVETVTRV
ncbi:hypothetical protein HY988_04480 [Candidatus Micrarchaeota archaeon]|nr:hypothetical protein [Candidatus Micrarchaeota archaeon]